MATEATQIKTIEAGALPQPGTWKIDPAHTTVEFVARHVLSRLRGRFEAFSGTITVGERPEDSRVEVDIDAASIQTNTEDRDNHLRSPDFLDAEQHPRITFRSTAVRPGKGSEFEVDGDLTIRGVTRPVTLAAECVGLSKDPWGNDLVAFSANTEIDREDWDVTWNVAIETGGVLVGKKVRIELEAEAQLVKDEG